MAGKSDKINIINIIPTVPADSSLGWQQANVIIPSNTIAFNTETKELKIGNGNTFEQTSDHKHYNQYSPMGHEHIGGYNEKWFRTMPRLILTTDLEKYPELIPLNGQTVTDEIAASLSELYGPGIGKISPLVIGGDQSKIIAVASSEKDDTYNFAWKLFGPDLTLENYLVAMDQWLVESGTNAILNLEFVGEATYLLDNFTIFARVGDPDTPGMDGPSIKDFNIESSVNGTDWTTIHTSNDLSEWTIGEGRNFTLTTPTVVKYLRFNFTEWHMSANPAQTLGLKRIMLYGKCNNLFTMPKMIAPDGFTWVVPYKDLGIGMKHEEVGDIVYCPKDVLVSPINRVKANGQYLEKSIEPDLFELIGHNYDRQEDLSIYSFSTISPFTTSINDNTLSWTSSDPDNTNLIEYLEITPTTNVISGYSFTPINGIVPTHWLLETYDGTTWTTIHDKTFDPETDTFDQIFKISTDIDATTINKYRLSVITWIGTGNLGLVNFKLYGHEKNKYRIPNVTYTENDDIFPYIVTRVRTEDVNSGIVLQLQTDLARALNMLIAQENRITAIEAQLANNP